ncbi:MAG: hypothetical protein V3V55_03980 [Rhodospirillales bacterium]
MRQRGGVARARVETAKAAVPARRFAESFSFSKGQIDPETGVYVILLRDSATGEVRVQIPAKRAASNYRKSQSIGGPEQGGHGGEDKPRPVSPEAPETDRSEENT